jgi:hypothetical protein
MNDWFTRRVIRMAASGAWGGRLERFLAWDAGPDLAQATWEWPARWMGRWIEPATFTASKDALTRWVNDARPRMERKFYGN